MTLVSKRIYQYVNVPLLEFAQSQFLYPVNSSILNEQNPESILSIFIICLDTHELFILYEYQLYVKTQTARSTKSYKKKGNSVWFYAEFYLNSHQSFVWLNQFSDGIRDFLSVTKNENKKSLGDNILKKAIPYSLYILTKSKMVTAFKAKF